MEMNEDGYGNVINGPLTYARIAEREMGQERTEYEMTAADVTALAVVLARRGATEFWFKYQDRRCGLVLIPQRVLSYPCEPEGPLPQYLVISRDGHGMEVTAYGMQPSVKFLFSRLSTHNELHQQACDFVGKVMHLYLNGKVKDIARAAAAGLIDDILGVAGDLPDDLVVRV